MRVGSPYLDKVEELVRVVEGQLVSGDAAVSPVGRPRPVSGVNLSSVNSALT